MGCDFPSQPSRLAAKKVAGVLYFNHNTPASNLRAKRRCAGQGLALDAEGDLGADAVDLDFLVLHADVEFLDPDSSDATQCGCGFGNQVLGGLVPACGRLAYQLNDLDN